MKPDKLGFIVHFLIVDDLQHIPSNPKMMLEFLFQYKKSFKTTGGLSEPMKMLVGLKVQ